MNNASAGLYVTANSTIQSALAAGSPLITGWTADDDYLHGDASIVVDATTGKLTLVPGIYNIHFDGVVEAPETSGAATSGDAFGEVTFSLYRGGSLVAGSKCPVDLVTAGIPLHVGFDKVIEITEAQLEAGTNYVQVYAVGTDVSGNDILVKEARFHATRQS